MLNDLFRTLHLPPVLLDLVAVVCLLATCLLLGFALNRVFHYWSEKFRGGWGELFFALLQPLPVPLLLLAGLSIALNLFHLPLRWQHIESKVLLALTVAVLFYFPAKVVLLFLGRLVQKEPRLERIAAPASFVMKALFALIGVVIILENLGIHLTAVWTTLGIGGVAVALALQDTLTNFFAGFYVIADRPINLGDYIKLESGQEGYVIHIGWRSTRIRTLPNNIVVLPNSTLAKAVLTNFSMPEPRMSLTIPVGVAYGTDPTRVENVLVEIAKEAAGDGIPGLLASPEPFVRFIPGFGDSSLDFSLTVQVGQFVDQYLVQHELRKRIVERFQKEGIEFPFPTRTLTLDKSLLALLEGRARNPRTD
jgi:small-conductance mechanosensitive channel